MTLSRRAALSLGAAAPLAAALPSVASASAEMKGMSIAKSRRVPLGGFEVTTLLAGTVAREEPQSIFGMNVSAEEFAAVSEDNFLPTDKVQFFFTPTPPGRSSTITGRGRTTTTSRPRSHRSMRSSR